MWLQSGNSGSMRDFEEQIYHTFGSKVLRDAW